MKKLLAAFTSALAVAAAPGCTAPKIQTVSMTAICLPPEDALKCAGSAGACDVYLASARPWFYTQYNGVPNGLEQFTETHNQAPDNSDDSAGRVDTNTAVITGYELDFASAYYNRTAYFYPANFSIPSNSVFSPVIMYIPPEIAMEMSTFLPPDASTPVTVTVTVRLRGHLLDGHEFNTGDFSIAVDVFNANFLSSRYVCEKAGDVFWRACPNGGQTASFGCITP